MAKRILFVEDERWSVEDYFPPLKDRGVEADLVRDGDKAVSMLRKKKFDLIALDIMFPPGEFLGSNVEARRAGVELLRKIRSGEIEGSKTPADVKVVVLTAVLEASIIDELKQLRGIHLSKPIEFSKAIETLVNA